MAWPVRSLQRVGLGQKRRRARDEQAHMRRRFAVSRASFEQADIEGRHAHQGRGARQQPR